MDNSSFTTADGTAAQRSPTVAPLATIGIVIAIVLPMIAAMLYPTYTTVMDLPWVQWTRRREFVFVTFEIMVLLWAMRDGLQLTMVWSKAPRDIRLALIILAIGCSVSSIVISKFPAESMLISLVTMIHILFFTSVCFFTKRTTLDQDMLLKSLSLGLVALGVMTAIRFAIPPDPSHVLGGQIVWGSALPGFISVRHFGAWTGAICAAFAALLLTRDANRRLSWPHICYVVAAAMTIWSGTRAAIVAIAIATLIVVAITRKLPAFKTVAVLTMLTGAALTAAWLVLPDDPTFRLFNAAQDLANSDEFTGGRLSLWHATFARWLQSPLLGWGSGSMQWEVYVGWVHSQPHNFVLESLISWGLIGASGAVWLVVRATVAAHRQVMRFQELLPMLAILDALLVQSMLEGMLHYPRFIMLIAFLLALILTYRPSEESALARR